MIDTWSVATVYRATHQNGSEERTGCMLMHFTVPVLFTLPQCFSICGCIDFEWNPQMSQIGFSQLCRVLALFAVLVHLRILELFWLQCTFLN